MATVLVLACLAIGSSYLVARAKARSIAAPYAQMFLPGTPHVRLGVFQDGRPTILWNFAYMRKDVLFPEDFPPQLLISWRGEVLLRHPLFIMQPQD